MNTELSELLPFLIPLIILQAVLTVTALVMILKQQTFKYFNKLVWAIIVLLLNTIGPIAYFVMERR